MRHSGLLRMGVAVITIVISGCSKNGTKPTSAEQSGARPGAVGAGGAGANVGKNDDFVRDVALKNMAEIELSRLALATSTDTDIKSFAQRLVDDHSAAGTKLTSALSGTTIEQPDQLDETHRKSANELAQKQGVEFDREYLKLMIDGHQDFAAKLESRLDVQSLADWKTAAAARTQSEVMPEPTSAMGDVTVRPDKSGDDSTMKINQWAADTYPVAQKHLDAARRLENVTKTRATK